VIGDQLEAAPKDFREQAGVTGALAI